MLHVHTYYHISPNSVGSRNPFGGGEATTLPVGMTVRRRYNLSKNLTSHKENHHVFLRKSHKKSNIYRNHNITYTSFLPSFTNLTQKKSTHLFFSQKKKSCRAKGTALRLWDSCERFPPSSAANLRVHPTSV